MTKLTLDQLAKKYQSLKDRFTQLERDVRSLKDLLNVHDNWNSTIRKWVGKVITVCDRSGQEESGILKWSDRYNLAVELTSSGRTRVYTKGGINWIESKD